MLIEVKLSTEAAKAGAAPGEVPALVEAIRGCPHLRLLGLMTMPPWSDDAEKSRPYFARLRELAGQNGLQHLSMGMSHDLEVAIEEGATIVRVGTALFGPRRKAVDSRILFASATGALRRGRLFRRTAARAGQPLGAVQVNARDADVPLYHLGNNRLHGEIYEQALKTPGVAVLHDAVLHHFFLGGENEREYVAEFVYNYGHWSEDLARELWRRRSRSAADPEYFRYPMIKRVVAAVACCDRA